MLCYCLVWCVMLCYAMASLVTVNRYLGHRWALFMLVKHMLIYKHAWNTALFSIHLGSKGLQKEIGDMLKADASPDECVRFVEGLAGGRGAFMSCCAISCYASLCNVRLWYGMSCYVMLLDVII